MVKILVPGTPACLNKKRRKWWKFMALCAMQEWNEELHFGTLPWPAVHQPNDDPENMKQPSGGWHSCVLPPSPSRFLRLSHSRFLWLTRC